MERLPREIPIQFGEEVFMGTRGEFRSLCSEALEEVIPIKEYEASVGFDHFTRMKGALTEATPNPDYESKAHWEKRYQEVASSIN